MENKGKEKKKARLISLAVVSLLLFSLCGCQKQDNSMKEQLQSLGENSASGEALKESSNSLRKQLHIPEELQIEDILDDTGKLGYRVDCKVDMPIERNPAIYQQKQRSFTKEEITKKAQKLFDSGEYFYVKPLDCYTLEELREEAASVERVIENENKKDTDYYWHRRKDLETYETCFKKSGVKEYKEGEFTKGAGAATYDKILIIEGKIGGEGYHLLAFTSNGHNYLKLCRLDAGYSITDLTPYFGYKYKYIDFEEQESEVAGSSGSMDTMGDEVIEAPDITRSLMNEVEATQKVRDFYGENKCSYSEEEAEKLALQYAALFGDTDMVVTKTQWGVVFSADMGENESITEGSDSDINSYIFYLQPQYGGLTCNESNFWWREATDMKEEIAREADPLGIVAEQQNYRVEVTDKGVVSIDTIEPWYEITETLSESAGLMDFNDIEELAKGYFAEEVKGIRVPENSGRSIMIINEVVLRYATVVDDGKYALIPCWFFNNIAGDGIYSDNSTIMVINAVDGSKVFLR